MEEKISCDTKVYEATLINTAQAAELISEISGETISPKTVANWRNRKLFGCVFFPADVKQGSTWYYDRERVLNLALVYQKGILQNMYKLARKFESVEFSENFQKTDSSSNILSTLAEMKKISPSFYPADEVAQILNTTEMQLSRWRESGKFVEDMTDHLGIYWYSADRVFAFQSADNQAKNFVPMTNEAVEQTLISKLEELFQSFSKIDPALKPKVTIYKKTFNKLLTKLRENPKFPFEIKLYSEYEKLSDIIKDAGIDAKITVEKDYFSDVAWTEIWTVQNTRECDLLIQSALKYLDEILPKSTEQFSDPLQEVKKKLAEFESDKTAAIELLKNVETFDSKSVFSDEVINAAATAKLYYKQTFSEFTRALKNYGDKHPLEKVFINDWKAAVKDSAEEIAAKYKDLLAELHKAQAAIDSDNFLADNPDLKNFTIPDGFSVSRDGVYKIEGEKSYLVCRCPVIISGKTKSTEEKNYKLILQYWTKDGKRRTLPAMPASTIFNRATIIKLTDYGLPTSSHTSTFLADYLDAFNVENDSAIPVTDTVPRCGWYTFDDTDIFVDPRRDNTITDDGESAPLIVDNSSQFATTLTSKGTLENWKKAYDLAKNSPVARATVAAALAAPLLKVLGERNFLIYIKAFTRAGKSTALNLGASAVGNEKMIRSFDATKNGLLGAAADVNDYSFLVDEKQVTDNRLAEQFQLIVYALANGIGRTKLNKDSTVKKTADWRVIALMTGESDLLADNATGGAYTRLLQFNAPKTILSASACKEIRSIIKDNYGLIMPRFIDKIFEYGAGNLLAYYEEFQTTFAKIVPDILSEYQRYIAVLTLADFLLNLCLGEDEKTASTNAVKNAGKIFQLVPTLKEIDDTTREIEMVEGFLAQYQSRFIGGNVEIDKMKDFYGKIEYKNGGEIDCVFITVAALKTACSENDFNYSKVVTDLIAANVFVPSDKIPKGCKTPLNTHQKKIGGAKTNCYKFVINTDSTDDTDGFANDFTDDVLPEGSTPF